MDDRSSITNIEKLYYLLNCLGADASDVMKRITVLKETYSIAWSTLVERYDDKMLSSATALVQESVASLNKFLCTFYENISVLELLQIPDLGDFLLFSVAFRLFPFLLIVYLK